MDAKAPAIDDLLRFMVKQNASDLHLKPRRPPLVRINGKLYPLKAAPLDPAQIPPMLNAIMTERQRDALEQLQSVDFGHSVPGLSRFRASVFQQRGTLSAVFRRVPFDFPSLRDWGLPAVIDQCATLPQGLVLITGPTGSGKSSTLAALMRLIADTRMVHIVTVEDPIEFLLGDNLAAVTQREIGTDTPSSEVALRNALRQDPDVIMVGEMRDFSTIQTVLTAAETGHLVFSTVHTNSAAQTIDRIIDAFPSGSHRQVRQQLSSVLQAVISMKLVERSDGKGLIAAIEILRRSPRVSKLILEGNLEALDEEVENSVSYYGMQTMNQSLAALVINGAISVESALAASINPGDLDLMLRRFLYAAEQTDNADGGEMSECLSDFSKIRELQEIKRLYDELQERHRQEIAERDGEIARLQAEGAQGAAPDADAERLRQEHERLTRQVQAMRDDYEGKIERLNARIRELSGTPGRIPVAAEAEKKGFFRR